MKRHLPLLASAILGAAAILTVLLRFGYPNHGAVAAILYAGGWIFFLRSLRRYRITATALDAANRKIVRHWGLALIALGLAGGGYLIFVIFPAEDRRWLELDPAELRPLIAADAAAAARSGLALEAFSVRAGELAPLAGKKFTELTEAERIAVLDLWRAALDHFLALETLKARHRHFYQINYLRYPELNLRSFLTADAAFLANFRGALWLRDFVGNNDSLATALDEARPELGIPGKLYSRLQLGLTKPETLVLLNAGRAHLEFVKRSGHLASPGDQALLASLVRANTEIFHRLGQQPTLFAENPLKFFEQTTFTLWFPVQQEVSEQMGDIRTTRRANLITEAQAHSVRPRLEPGDIMLERRNWYLSNLGLPGFWPHAALYTGDLEELDRYFTGGPALGDKSFSSFLREKFPAVHQRYLERHDGHAPSVLEAISEGVILHPFELSAAADYLAMLRPRLSKADKLRAILTAYTFLGRPYDFNFDFVTDHELVCSEVVFKAYYPTARQNGLHFELTRTAGRLVLGPNDIVRKYDLEFGAPRQELDFVLFLDGSEAAGRAGERDAAGLRTSWRRPKWDLAQE